jgi:hypothetical protein
MPRADLSPLSTSVSNNAANLLMAGSTVKSGMDVKLEMRYGGQADAGSYAGHMGSIMDNGGAFLNDRVNSTNYVGRRGGGGGGGANPTARNFGPSNPGGYNWNTVDKGVNFVNKKLKNVNNAMTQSRNDYNSNLISNKITEIGDQYQQTKKDLDDYNKRIVPRNRMFFTNQQAAFNAPTAGGGSMHGPIPVPAGLNVNRVNRIPTPWAQSP